ncbi:hypothetical protein A2U01_0012873, partial [Trifolium medium]|nr:hypothetical protein [Trifolium medium]
SGTWKALKFGKGSSPSLSHINFADDLVLIVEATSNQDILTREIKILSMSCWLSDNKATEKATQAVKKCRKNQLLSVPLSELPARNWQKVHSFSTLQRGRSEMAR